MKANFEAFSIAKLPRLEFGAGKIRCLPDLITPYGKSILVVTGGASFLNSAAWQDLQQALQQAGIHWQLCQIHTEPSPHLIDELVQRYAGQGIKVVVGIGGGSALDAAKAIAGLLEVGQSVMDFLEGVGPELPYPGPSIPLIAIPTTAGTGSEATKNAVLSVQGADGFKKSFRDDRLVAEYAVLDPDLLATCPPDLIAANGMDALTQLMESYVSMKANPFTDALAISGLRALRDSLLIWYQNDEGQVEAREKMAYAAWLSGITLAQCGLGSVHGLASPLGAFYPIPHGVVCGSLVAVATEVNIRAMQSREPENPGLPRYARLAEIICEQRLREPEMAYQALVKRLWQWTEAMQLPNLSRYGVTLEGLDHVVAHSRGSSMRTNPVVLTDEEIRSIVERRL